MLFRSFLEGYLTNLDPMSIVANAIQLVLSILVWYPFFKIYEKRELEQEAMNMAESNSAISEEDAKLLDDLDLDF